MAKYGSDVFKTEIDATDGGALQDMSQHVDTINGVNIERLMQESHTFGDSWVEHLYTGIRQAQDITLEGFYDDTASTGPDATFNGTHAVTRSVQLTYGGSKTSSFEAWIVGDERLAARGELQRYRVVLRPTGAVTEA